VHTLTNTVMPPATGGLHPLQVRLSPRRQSSWVERECERTEEMCVSVCVCVWSQKAGSPTTSQ
jgi:hypothetical protein